MIDNYVYVIIALLPLASLMVLLENNPYHALVIRAILGAVAALVYAVLGAADVALTEALVGTMLAITLYVVAVRSSLVMRLGVLEVEAKTESYFAQLIASLRKTINKHHLRLELVEYPNPQSLEQALMAKEVHAICTNINGDGSDQVQIGSSLVPSQSTTFPGQIGANQVILTQVGDRQSDSASKDSPSYHTTTRVRRLFEIMQTEAHLPQTTLTYVTVSNVEDIH